MYIDPTLSEPAGPAGRAPEGDAERQARHLDVLRELAERGMRLTRLAERRAELAVAAAEAAQAARTAQAAPQPDDPVRGEPAPPVPAPREPLRWIEATARIGRDVRLTLAMERRVAAGLAPLPERPARPDRRRRRVRELLLDAAAAERPLSMERPAEIIAAVEAALDATPEPEGPDRGAGWVAMAVRIARELDLKVPAKRLAAAQAAEAAESAERATPEGPVPGGLPGPEPPDG